MERKIIIVGNGPSILSHKKGEEIDAFENVVRLNEFVIRGFEEHVGVKTTQWVGNEYFPRNTIRTIDFIDGTITTHRVIDPSIPPKFHCLFPFDGYSNYDVLMKEFSLLPYFSQITFFERSMAEELSQLYDPQFKVWPSTGICALWYFKPCHCIGIDGFGPICSHYYNNKTTSDFKSHSYVREREFFQWMVKENMVCPI